MKQRILIILFALIAMAQSNSAQTLSVQPIEIQTGEQTQVAVSFSGGTSATALQFCLNLPNGVSLSENSGNYGVTLGNAVDGHTLCVEKLASGDLLFILYSMDFKSFADGELLRIPVTSGNNAVNATGLLYNVRTATADAISHTANNASFNVTIIESTGIDGVKSDDQRFDVYTLSGVLVKKAATSMEGLKKGVYIINKNRKIVMK